MNAINYLKFDLRIIGKTMKYYVLIPVVFCVSVMFVEKQGILGATYLLFFLIIIAQAPFGGQANEKSTAMYYMFPSKISSMVLGRLLYLIISTIIIFTIDGAMLLYSYKTNAIQASESVLLCIFAIITLIICFCQYPLYYKFGMEKGRMILLMVYLIPAFAIFMIPSLLVDSGSFINGNLSNIIFWIGDNRIISICIAMTISITSGYISYLVSFGICKRKEVY